MRQNFDGQKGFGIVMAFYAVVAIVIMAGGGYILNKKYPVQGQKQFQRSDVQKKTSELPNTVETNRIDGQKERDLQIQGTSTAMVVVKNNIGIKNDIQKAVVCADKGCFDEKFKVCKKAIFRGSGEYGVIFDSEIIGPENKLCKVKVTLVGNPGNVYLINGKMIGEEMVCLYDNTTFFRGIFNPDMKKCEGQLADDMEIPRRMRDARDSKRWADVSELMTAIKIDQIDNGGLYLGAIRDTNAGKYYLVSNGTSTICNLACDKPIGFECVNLHGLVTEGYLGTFPISPIGTSTWSSMYTGYYLKREDSGIITVGACESENTDNISVTR